jgi:hypothetical protein
VTVRFEYPGTVKNSTLMSVVVPDIVAIGRVLYNVKVETLPFYDVEVLVCRLNHDDSILHIQY